MPMYKRAQIGLGYLSQEPSVFSKLSVEDNLRLVLELTEHSKEEQNDILDKAKSSTLDDLYNCYAENKDIRAARLIPPAKTASAI